MDKRIRNAITGILLSAAMVLTALCPVGTVWAEDAAPPAEGEQATPDYTVIAGAQDYHPYAHTVKSYLQELADGTLMSVNYATKKEAGETEESTKTTNVLLIDYYTQDENGSYTHIPAAAAAEEGDNTEKTPKEVSLEGQLGIFGGFYAAKNGSYYVLTGQRNPDQSAQAPVYQIQKYNSAWEKVGDPAIMYGSNTTRPFDAGSARMAESSDGQLIIKTCHAMYKAYDGYCHQANMYIQLDMATMKITNSYTGMGRVGNGYVSHSFNQFVKADDDYIVAIDHGDCYPRSVVLTKSWNKISGRSFAGFSSTNLLAFRGRGGDNSTNASVGGFEVSSSAYLVAGSSVDQTDNTSVVKNIFVAAVDKNLRPLEGRNVVTYLTDYSEGATTTPHLVKVKNKNGGDSSDTYIVLWQRKDDLTKVYYQYINAKGEPISDAEAEGTADTQPLTATTQRAKLMEADAAETQDSGNYYTIKEGAASLSDLLPVSVITTATVTNGSTATPPSTAALTDTGSSNPTQNDVSSGSSIIASFVKTDTATKKQTISLYQLKKAEPDPDTGSETDPNAPDTYEFVEIQGSDKPCSFDDRTWGGGPGSSKDPLPNEITEAPIENDGRGSTSSSAGYPLNEFTITFDTNGGSIYGNASVLTSSWRLPYIPVVTKSGYTFLGWYTSLNGGTIVDQWTQFNQNCTLYAHWKEDTESEFTITFDANGGTMAGNASQATVQQKLTGLPSADRDGYQFVGWYLADGTPVTTTYQFHENVTVYAHWQEKPAEYTITFHANGGTLTGAASMVTVGGKLLALPDASRDGYAFDGWYDRASGGTQILASHIFQADTTIYAHWAKTTVSVEKVTLQSVKSPSAGKLKATWKRCTGVSGYQVAYSKTKSFPSSKKTAVKNVNAAYRAKTFSVSGKGKTYYVRVRAYKKVGGKKYYGNWSNVKKTKIKK